MPWSLSNIQAIGSLGVSPHLEIDGDNIGEKYQLYYSSTERNGLAIDGMSTNLELTQQGVLSSIQDLTIVTTNQGIRRAYYIDLDEIYTALISDDGLTLSQVQSTGISNKIDKKNAWGVPDAVVLPNGKIRIYWVDDDPEANKQADEFIKSATSTTTEGTNFIVDEGKRVEGGYVDFEVLKAKNNDWLAIMSSSPETIPSKPQGIYVGTSNDGLTWDINETNLAPTNKSYLDPTGLLFPDSTDKWRIVMSESPSILGEREYSLVAAELKLVSSITTYSGNSYDYTFLNLGSAGYGIKPDTGGTTDSLTGITTLKFDNKSLNIVNDIKATFDQVTGLNTDSGEMFRLYNAAFARFPDADGLKYWIDEFSSGRNTRRVVAQSFLGSAEFTEKYGSNVSDETYVNNLYKNVLGRDADTEGLNYWVGNLSSGLETRYEALLGFAESAENKALFTEMTGFG